MQFCGHVPRQAPARGAARAQVADRRHTFSHLDMRGRRFELRDGTLACQTAPDLVLGLRGRPHGRTPRFPPVRERASLRKKLSGTFSPSRPTSKMKTVTCANEACGRRFRVSVEALYYECPKCHTSIPVSRSSSVMDIDDAAGTAASSKSALGGLRAQRSFVESI